METDIN